MSVHGAGACSSSSMSSRHMAVKSPPKSGISTIQYSPQHLPTRPANACVGIVKEISSNNSSGCPRKGQNPGLGRHPERHIRVRNCGGRPIDPFERFESPGTEIGIEVVSRSEQVEIRGQSGQSGEHDTVFCSNPRQVHGQKTEVLRLRSSLAAFQSPQRPFAIPHAAPKARDRGCGHPAGRVATDQRQERPRAPRRQRSAISGCSPFTRKLLHDPPVPDLVRGKLADASENSDPLNTDAQLSGRLARGKNLH